MSPTQYTPKTEPNNGLYDSTPPQLKINKDSHFIKKSSSPPPSSSLIGNSTATPTKPQPRQPVIIYTHSPKIIHTHPRDFMALVQKLTGYSRSSDDDPAPNGNNSSLPSQGNNDHKGTINRCVNINNDQDNESTNSVITDENGSTCMGHDPPQVNSCFVPAPAPMFDPMINPCFNNIPFFAPSNADFLCSTATTNATSSSFYNYADSLFLMPNNIRSSMSSSSSSSLEGMKDFPDI